MKPRPPEKKDALAPARPGERSLPASGHRFDPDLRCRVCGVAFAEHRAAPRRCVPPRAAPPSEGSGA